MNALLNSKYRPLWVGAVALVLLPLVFQAIGLGYGFKMEDATTFAVLGAAICLPIFNGAGRIIWGQVSDKIGRRKALLSMFLFQGVMIIVFFYSTMNPYFFYLVAAFIGFNFGGNFALFPAACADSFGAENLGLNYGFIFPHMVLVVLLVLFLLGWFRTLV